MYVTPYGEFSVKHNEFWQTNLPNNDSFIKYNNFNKDDNIIKNEDQPIRQTNEHYLYKTKQQYVCPNWTELKVLGRFIYILREGTSNLPKEIYQTYTNCLIGTHVLSF